MAALGEVLQPFAEECVHAHAVVEHSRRRRIHSDDILPALSDIAVRRFDLARVAVQAQECRWIGLTGLRIPEGICHPQFGGVRVLHEYVDPKVQSILDTGHIGARHEVGGFEQPRQALNMPVVHADREP